MNVGKVFYLGILESLPLNASDFANEHLFLQVQECIVRSGRFAYSAQPRVYIFIVLK